MKGVACRVLLVLVLIGLPGLAGAQDRAVAVRVSADVGVTAFAASRSFEAVTGSRAGGTFGGGIEAILRDRVSVGVRVSRFAADGHRVFVFDGEVFPLDVPARISVTPVDITGTYRFTGRRLVPYAGGGVGWHRYSESSPVADPGENVRDTFLGYHLVGGAELPLRGWIALAGEARWTHVPDALSGGAAAAFGETNLGGITALFRVVVGR